LLRKQNAATRQRSKSAPSTTDARNERRRESRRRQAAEAAATKQESEQSLAAAMLGIIDDEMKLCALARDGPLIYTPVAVVLVVLFSYIVGGMSKFDGIKQTATTRSLSITTVYKYYYHFLMHGSVYEPYASVIGSRIKYGPDADIAWLLDHSTNH
jgi:hypothetical protein